MKTVLLLLTMVMLMAIALNADPVAPANVGITHSGNVITLDWDPSPGAVSYRIYASDDPYGVYVRDNSGTFPTATSWEKSESAELRFYQVTASTSLDLEPIDLGTAGNFVILSKAGISSVPASDITGDIGVSPVAASYITGFSLIMDPSNVFSTSTQVTGNVYAADYADPTPANLTAAISDMETAYTNAAGVPTPDFINLGSGNISGLTLVPGLYKWSTGVLLTSAVTLNGGPDEVWIFQVAGGITLETGANVTLAGGASPQNIFWQAAEAVTLGTGAHLEGNVLGSTNISLANGASINGRLLAQTGVTLDQSIVTLPTP